MKFAIRYAEQIIGALVILALAALIFVIFMLGSSQRWFSKDYEYKTYFLSANGLSPNMPVQYKGFTIGHVKSISLSEYDEVEVIFTIFDTYHDRVAEGSLVELIVSPIGALGGSSFMFYPGIGSELIPEFEVIPEINSYNARQLMVQGLTAPPIRDDSISNIISQVGATLETLHDFLGTLNEAFAGTNRSSLGRIVGGIETAVRDLPQSIDETIANLMVQLNPILQDVEGLLATINSDEGTVGAILDSQGPVYQELIKSLESVSGTLRNLEKTTDFIPSQLPQIAGVLSSVGSALKTAEDVLVALTNNPILKGGIPEHKETNTGGMRPRDMGF